MKKLYNIVLSITMIIATILVFIFKDPNINYIDSFNIDKITTLHNRNSSFQGMTIYKDYIYQFHHGGLCDVVHINAPNNILYSFELESASSDNHCNTVNFSDIYYCGNDIPLLYVTGGNNPNDFICYVENISLENSAYTSSLIQTISLNQDDFKDYELTKMWGLPNWLVDNINHKLIAFSAIYRTNGSMYEYDYINQYIITEFTIPDLTEPYVTLTGADVINQFCSPYIAPFTQGGTIHNNTLYYTFGMGNETFPNKILIWDLENEELTNVINLDTRIIGDEIEDCCYYNDCLYIVCQSGSLYRLYNYQLEE